MEIWEQISRQRVKYIVDSYQLDGDDDEDFYEYLEDLLQAYAPPQIELALVEILIQSWRITPLVRGVTFLERSHVLLKSWENKAIAPNLSPVHFRLITGLDPTPIFGNAVIPQSGRTISAIVK
jgi:AcrR family transcriptional regulator